jgi:hypothetical protein
MRLIWYSAPTIFSQARRYNNYLTTNRAEHQTALSEKLMRGMGVSVIDAEMMTRARLDANYDGLHYARQVQRDEWQSQVAAAVYQAALNTIFPMCAPESQGAEVAS